MGSQSGSVIYGAPPSGPSTPARRPWELDLRPATADGVMPSPGAGWTALGGAVFAYASSNDASVGFRPVALAPSVVPGAGVPVLATPSFITEPGLLYTFVITLGNLQAGGDSNLVFWNSVALTGQDIEVATPAAVHTAVGTVRATGTRSSIQIWSTSTDATQPFIASGSYVRL